MVGIKLIYNVPVSTPKEDLTTFKIHWNSFLSTPDRKYLIVDVKKFYLNNLMNKSEYYKIEIKLIPQEIIDKYELNTKQIYGYIYVRAKTIMYGLVQAGIIGHKVIKENIKPYAYAPERITQGLWKHQDRDINLTLVVDNFGIRYINKKDADHLISEPQAKY